MDIRSISKIKDTQISYDEIQNMYFMDLGMYKFFAEQIYYYVWWVERFFNHYEIHDKQDFCDFFEGSSFIYRDIIISKSNFYNFNIYNFFDINSENRYSFITHDARFYNFQIKDKSYYIVIYIDINSKLQNFTNFLDDDFEIVISKSNFILKNKVFGTEILNYILNFNNNLDYFNKNILDEELSNMMSIADFYIFEDMIWNTDFSSYISFFEYINGKKINLFHLWDYENITNKNTDSFIVINFNKLDNPLFPYWKIEIKYQPDWFIWFEEWFWRQIKKLIFSFFYEFYLALIINNKEIEDYFNQITNLWEIDFISWIWKYKIGGSDIFWYDVDLITLKNSFNYLKYLLYTLHSNLEKINNITQEIDSSNPHYELLKARNILNKQSLEKNIERFEDVFKKYLDVLTKI